MNCKIGSWFFILMLFSGLILIFSPNMVVSGSYASGYYVEDFDSQTLLDTNLTFVQSGEIWGTLTAWNSHMGRSADDHWHVFTYGSGRAYKCAASGPGAYDDHFWMEVNFSIDNVTYLYIDSDNLLGTPPDAWNAGFKVYLNNSAGGTIATMGYFWTGPSSGKPHLSLNCDGATTIVDANNNVTTDFAITLFDNESVYMIAHGYKNSTDAGVNVSQWSTTVAGFDDISVMAIYVSAVAYKTRHYYFDNLTIYDVMGGDITINVYNESSPSTAIPSWDLYITDENSIILNSSTGNNNPLVIDIPIFGPGERFFYVNASGYDTRVFYAEISRGINYTLNAFLPYSDISHLYYIKVINEYGKVINDAEITIVKQLNGSIHEMASGFTNAYGMYPVYLIGGDSYKINITASGYDSLIMEEFTTDPSSYGVEYPIIFSLGSEHIYVPDIYLEDMVLSPYNSTTMLIYYLNLNENNSFVTFDVYDVIGDSLLASYNISVYPNNISIYFNFSSYGLSGDILKVIAHPYRTDGTMFTITKYFNVEQSRRKGISASSAIMAILSVGITLFGLTIAHPKKTFGPIGIIVIIIAIAITAFAEQTWYIQLVQAMDIILLMFVILVFKEEGMHAV